MIGRCPKCGNVKRNPGRLCARCARNDRTLCERCHEKRSERDSMFCRSCTEALHAELDALAQSVRPIDPFARIAHTHAQLSRIERGLG